MQSSNIYRGPSRPVRPKYPRVCVRWLRGVAKRRGSACDSQHASPNVPRPGVYASALSRLTSSRRFAARRPRASRLGDAAKPRRIAQGTAGRAGARLGFLGLPGNKVSPQFQCRVRRAWKRQKGERIAERRHEDASPPAGPLKPPGPAAADWRPGSRARPFIRPELASRSLNPAVEAQQAPRRTAS